MNLDHRLVVAGIASLLFSSGYADVNVQTIALNCLSCHDSPPGAAEGVIPLLDKLSAQQLLQALVDFKYDKRLATLMPRIAKGYSDQELAAVAEYLSGH